VDDEALARERIRALLRCEGDIAVTAECETGAEAIAAIRDRGPSIVFLDVQMPKIGGFDILSAIPSQHRPPAVIFVTAYEEHAVRAFEVNAIDYLLKPYTKDRFRAALQRARKCLTIPASVNRQCLEQLLQWTAKHSAGEERIAVKSESGVEFVRASDIDWLQADGNYAWLHVGRRPLRTRELLSRLEADLTDAGFVRIHRSVVVNAARIVKIETSSHGEYEVLLSDGTRLRSSRTYGEAVRRMLKT
jgi:two-component system LytT family response regulator